MVFIGYKVLSKALKAGGLARLATVMLMSYSLEAAGKSDTVMLTRMLLHWLLSDFG